MSNIQYTIVLTTEITDEAVAILRDASDIIVRQVAPTRASLAEHLPQAHALITRGDVLIDTELLQHALNLRIIARTSLHVDHVDIHEATKRGILLMNTPGMSTIASAEYAMALILALSRHVVEAHNSMSNGSSHVGRTAMAGVQLAGKTIGLIGIGRVGSLVAHRCIAFGMTILAYDPYVREETIDNRVHLVSLPTLLQQSDYISIHVPVTRETRDLINKSALEQTRRGVRIINTAHAPIIHEDALAAAIRSGHVAGAALDVADNDEIQHSPLFRLGNVLHTPHIHDNTLEAAQDISIKVVQQVLDALRDKDYRNVINMPIMPGVDYETIRPYINLTERMGKLFHSLSRNPVHRIAIEVRGEEMHGLIKPLTVGLLKGLLQPIVGSQVSAVNAPLLAHERGWQITQVKGLPGADYSNLITAQVKLQDGEEITITGILLDKSDPYIVQINQYRMKFNPEGILLIIGSYDKPGVIGRVGTLLSDNNINIAGWFTGRAQRGGNTLSILTLDEVLPEVVVHQLETLDFVRHVHQIEI